ncbi:RimK-like ATPgrasp N-terminal domain-containing protein [Legionella sp. W05-934-2]|jgi:glutathione synthase/RimK-type ligase-like ATP-grasp enzyme|uniref:RimK-like ATPgrasp N-terminal domain-containing protein n=1 Tax=Legionella sp. W05-934-2 TaxID=1198649 RepID=UPI003463131B
MHDLLVVDNSQNKLIDYFPDSVITFETYLNEYPKINEAKVNVINLCDADKYLSEGYYCSLLAAARNHFVIPTANTLNDMRGGIRIILNKKICPANELAWLENNEDKFPVYILGGKSTENAISRLAKNIFKLYPTPIIKITKGIIPETLNIERVCLNKSSHLEQREFISQLLDNNISSREYRVQNKKYRWDMAILVNPNEITPPSNKSAINLFVKAAAKLGIKADIVTADNLFNLSQYDALFVRETTFINHHTYRLVCEAEKLGMVVIDDSASILRCCNKVFLHDAFSYNKVNSLKTKIVSHFNKGLIDEIENEFNYPVVLKMPESSFSSGVYKASNREELIQKLEKIFENSALALVQEYMYTDFDWRIGVLNGRAIFACRYYMVRNHWQIYNNSKSKLESGSYDCLPTFEVPRIVLNAALRACKMIGNGLYGVDIKVKNKHAYVIEVNDNPSVDHHVEDQYLGHELYMQIMSEFLTRLEARGRGK